MSNAAETKAGCQPVIIVGSAHCGGAELRDALCTLPGFATWSWDDLNPLWGRGLPKVDHDELEAEQATEAVVRRVRTAFDRLASQSGAEFVVEFTPANSLRVPFVQAVLPDALFLFVVRDGRDVLLRARDHHAEKCDVSSGPHSATERLGSLLTGPFRALSQLLPGRARSPYGARFRGLADYQRRYGLPQTVAKQWASSVTRAAEAFEELIDADASPWGADMVLPLQFESLADDAADALWEICDFLDVDPGEAAVEAAADTLTNRQSVPWASQLTAGQLEPLAPTLDPVLVEFGYRSCSIPRTESPARRAA